MGIGDLAGGGGAERYFANLYDQVDFLRREVEIFFITDKESFAHFRKIGALKNEENLILISNYKNRFHKLLQTIEFLFRVVFRGIDIIHIGNFNSYYDFFGKNLRYIPARLRPKQILNIVDCRMAPTIEQFKSEGAYEGFPFAAYLKFFQEAHLDGIYSWYINFIEVAKRFKLIRSNPNMRAASYCFTDLEHYTAAPQKENQIVFAARLVDLKDPLMFVGAIDVLNRDAPELLEGWEVLLYGRGELEEAVKALVREKGLEEVITLGISYDMASIFAKSKAFVSTQHFENFTSLSMLEAMACGNAILSRNVGQTDYFVKEGQNGFLASQDDAKGMAEVLKKYLKSEELHPVFAQKSIEIATHIHTRDNFVEELVAYWQEFTT